MPLPDPPGLRQLLPLPYGLVAASRRDPLGFLLQGVRQFGDVFRYSIGPFTFHVLARPEHVKHVLQDRWANYPRSFLYRFTRPVIGDGLVSVEGDEWRRQRRTIQPGFNPARVDAMATAMTDRIAAMLDRWAQTFAASGEPFDLAQEMIRLTLEIVGPALLGVDLSAATDDLRPAITEILAYVDFRIANLVAAPLVVPTPRNLRFRRAMRTMDQTVYRIIADRRRNPSAASGVDLLSLLLTVRDPETGAALTDREVRDQVMTFIGAGHETTAVALAWTFALLGQHPAWYDRVDAEIRIIIGDQAPTVADVPNLPITQRVLRESMRLYPPIPAAVRDVVAEDAIAGYRIRKGSSVIVSSHVTHRQADVWPDPEAFDPDRFLPDRAASRPRFAWFPFLGGPHQCIGEHFAMTEATLTIAMTLQRFRVTLDTDKPIEARTVLSTRPRDGVPVRIRPV
jgi:cytochrome P450